MYDRLYEYLLKFEVLYSYQFSEKQVNLHGYNLPNG